MKRRAGRRQFVGKGTRPQTVVGGRDDITPRMPRLQRRSVRVGAARYAHVACFTQKWQVKASRPRNTFHHRNVVAVRLYKRRWGARCVGVGHSKSVCKGRVVWGVCVGGFQVCMPSHMKNTRRCYIGSSGGKRAPCVLACVQVQWCSPVGWWGMSAGMRKRHSNRRCVLKRLLAHSTICGSFMCGPRVRAGASRVAGGGAEARGGRPCPKPSEPQSIRSGTENQNWG